MSNKSLGDILKDIKNTTSQSIILEVIKHVTDVNYHY